MYQHQQATHLALEARKEGNKEAGSHLWLIAQSLYLKSVAEKAATFPTTK